MFLDFYFGIFNAVEVRDVTLRGHGVSYNQQINLLTN
ncbi:MAG: hypothetical protein ACJA1H_001949 [Glaciecola sp.]|jgi:hypothetical protein